MTNLVTVEPEGKFLQVVPRQVGRSSLTFVGLLGIMCLVLAAKGISITNITLLNVTQLCFSLAFASFLYRLAMKAADYSKFKVQIRTMGISCLTMVILNFHPLAHYLTILLPPELSYVARLNLGMSALIGTFLFDAVYTAVLYGLKTIPRK